LIAADMSTSHSSEPHGITPSPVAPPNYADEKGNPDYSVDVNDVKDNSSSERDVEAEKVKDLGLKSTMSADGEEESKETSTIGRFYRKYKIFVHLAIWLVVTG
jgi:hypothetical protein